MPFIFKFIKIFENIGAQICCCCCCLGTYPVAVKLSKCRNKLMPFFLKVFWRFVAETSHVTYFSYVIHAKLTTFANVLVCQSFCVPLWKSERLETPPFLPRPEVPHCGTEVYSG